MNMMPKLLTLTLLAGLALAAPTATATDNHVEFGPIPPAICEPVTIGIDVPPVVNPHEECLPIHP